MQVDPEQLRVLAASMDRIGTEMDVLNVRAKADAVGPAMPGSSLGGACSSAAEFVEGAWLRMAMRCERYANLSRGNAFNYAVTDRDFQDGLKSMGGDR